MKTTFELRPHEDEYIAIYKITDYIDGDKKEKFIDLIFKEDLAEFHKAFNDYTSPKKDKQFDFDEYTEKRNILIFQERYEEVIELDKWASRELQKSKDNEAKKVRGRKQSKNKSGQ